MRMLLEFKKDDRIRYLGLLDLQRTMQRALRRSGLPVAYSNGYNPHIVMSFASALSSGIPGDAELVDVALAGDTDESACLEAMKRVLPPAMQPGRVRIVDDRFPKLGKILTHAGYTFVIRGEQADKLASGLPAFMAEREIIAVRKSKSAETVVNIRPMIHSMEWESGENETRIRAIVSFTESATLKPDLLYTTICRETGAEGTEYRVRRTGLYAFHNKKCVPLIEYPWP